MAIGGNGTTFVVYTTEEGGPYHAARCTREEFERIRETGEIAISHFPGTVIRDIAYAAFLCVIEANHDFVIDDSREDNYA